MIKSRGTRFRKGAAIGRTALVVAITVSVWLVVSMVPAARTGASTPTVHAVGSAEQVYVTGLAAVGPGLASHIPGEDPGDTDSGFARWPPVPQCSAGKRLPRGPIDSDGEESAPLTVHSDAAAPWDPSIYNQTISDNGYQYLTTRDGTKLAIDVHPPTDPAGEPGLPPGTPLPKAPPTTSLPTRR